MSTLSISIPVSLQSFVDAQVERGAFATSGDYISQLIRADQDRQRLRSLLLDGAASPPTEAIDDDDFEALRDRVRRTAAG